MNYIEELLFEKTKDFNEGHVYADQWEIAKSYLPQVLDTISHIFPHYSLHNSTHSEAIINNIIRILGPDSINKLSVVDLWLILAAAYYHDCGMAVTGKDKEKMFENGSDFVKYVEQKQQDQLSPMNQYAVLFAIKDNRIRVITKDNTGYGHSMNVGLKMATGKYIGIVESEKTSIRTKTSLGQMVEEGHFKG